MIGHCSQCHKIWTLDTPSGICQWCGKQATCQASRQAQRSIKTRRRQRHSDQHGDYKQLDGKWLTYYKVALPFSLKVPAQDREDLLHDIIIALADVQAN